MKSIRKPEMLKFCTGAYGDRLLNYSPCQNSPPNSRECLIPVEGGFVYEGRGESGSNVGCIASAPIKKVWKSEEKLASIIFESEDHFIKSASIIQYFEEDFPPGASVPTQSLIDTLNESSLNGFINLTEARKALKCWMKDVETSETNWSDVFLQVLKPGKFDNEDSAAHASHIDALIEQEDSAAIPDIVYEEINNLRHQNNALKSDIDSLTTHLKLDEEVSERINEEIQAVRLENDRLKRVYENFEESSEELRRVKSIKNKLEAHLQSTEKKLRASENETYLLREEIMRRETSNEELLQKLDEREVREKEHMSKINEMQSKLSVYLDQENIMLEKIERYSTRIQELNAVVESLVSERPDLAEVIPVDVLKNNTINQDNLTQMNQSDSMLPNGDPSKLNHPPEENVSLFDEILAVDSLPHSRKENGNLFPASDDKRLNSSGDFEKTQNSSEISCGENSVVAALPVSNQIDFILRDIPYNGLIHLLSELNSRLIKADGSSFDKVCQQLNVESLEKSNYELSKSLICLQQRINQTENLKLQCTSSSFSSDEKECSKSYPEHLASEGVECCCGNPQSDEVKAVMTTVEACVQTDVINDAPNSVTLESSEIEGFRNTGFCSRKIRKGSYDLDIASYFCSDFNCVYRPLPVLSEEPENDEDDHCKIKMSSNVTPVCRPLFTSRRSFSSRLKSLNFIDMDGSDNSSIGSESNSSVSNNDCISSIWSDTFVTPPDVSPWPSPTRSVDEISPDMLRIIENSNFYGFSFNDAMEKNRFRRRRLGILSMASGLQSVCEDEDQHFGPPCADLNSFDAKKEELSSSITDKDDCIFGFEDFEERVDESEVPSTRNLVFKNDEHADTSKYDIRTLSPEEISNKFINLSLAFKADKITLQHRADILKRHRETAEQNQTDELTDLKSLVNRFTNIYIDSENIELFNKMHSMLDNLERLNSKVSGVAEAYGAIQQESRAAEAVEVMLNHIENLRRVSEKEHTELEDMKRILMESNIAIENLNHGDLIQDEGVKFYRHRAHSITHPGRPEIRMRTKVRSCSVSGDRWFNGSPPTFQSKPLSPELNSGATTPREDDVFKTNGASLFNAIIEDSKEDRPCTDIIHGELDQQNSVSTIPDQCSLEAVDKEPSDEAWHNGDVSPSDPPAPTYIPSNYSLYLRSIRLMASDLCSSWFSCFASSHRNFRLWAENLRFSVSLLLVVTAIAIAVTTFFPLGHRIDACKLSDSYFYGVRLWEMLEDKYGLYQSSQPAV